MPEAFADHGGKGGSSKSPSKPAKKKARWLGALVDNVEEFARGLGPGFVALGKAAVHDTKDALDGGGHNFQFDDIGRAMALDYKKRYSPLLHGDFKGFEDQVATNPLSFLLDITGAAGLAGGSLGKLGEAAARTGAAAQEGSAAAKLAKYAGFVGRNEDTVAQAARVYGATSKEVKAGEASGLVKGVRTVGGKGRMAPLELPAKSNPLLRGRDAQVDKVLGSPRLEDTRIIGLASRSARHDRRMPAVAADAKRARVLKRPTQALKKLTRDEQGAWFFLHEKMNPAEYAGLLEKTKATADLSDHDRIALEATMADVQRPEIAALVANPTRNLQAAVASTKQLADADMPELVKRLSKLTQEDLDNRRLLSQRKLEGAQATTTHPENVVAREDGLQRVSAGVGGADRMRLRDAPATADIRKVKPGVEPTHDQAAELVAAAERKLKHGPPAQAKVQLVKWLGEFYDEQMHGTRNATTAMRREHAALEASARARAVRKPGEAVDVVQLANVTKRRGVWSREAAKLADNAGPTKDRLWRRLKADRAADPKFVQQFPQGSLERRLAQAGFHPTDRLANLPDDDGVANVIEEWLADRTGGIDVADIAHGAHDAERGTMDLEEAQSLVQEAKRLDPHLPDHPDDAELAYALADKFRPYAAPTNIIKRDEWVQRVTDAVLHVFTHEDKTVDVGAELPKIRGPIARELADRIGIRDAEQGIEPRPKDWASAFSEMARSAGFDDQYRADAKAAIDARTRLEKEGPSAFTDAFDRQQLDRPELVNPATGRLYRDELADMTPEERAAKLDAAGSYFPQKSPAEAAKGGGMRARGASMAAPKAEYKASIGTRLETGNFSRDPIMLLREADRLVRVDHHENLYTAMAERGAGTPFDRQTYRDTGGDRKWMVLDPKGTSALSSRLGRESATMRELEDLVPEETLKDIIGKIDAVTDEVVHGGNTDGLVMVPRAYAERMMADFRESNVWAQRLIDRPLDVFRTSVLFLRPAYYVNNVVGQGLLLAVKEKGPGFLPSYVSFLAHRGANLPGARQLFAHGVKDEATGWKMWDAVLETHGAGVSGASAYDVMVPRTSAGLRQRLAMSGTRKGQITAWAMSGPEELNRFGAILSDDLPRQFRFIRLMMPHVREARAAGETGDDAAIAMRLLDQDPVLHERVTLKVLDDLIDYRGMSAAERTSLRRVIPFYGWMRGITKWTADLGYNHPDELLALAGVSKVGQADNAQWNDVVPEWLQGAIRVGGQHGDTQRVINTQGLNPLGTIGDLAMIARGALGDRPDRSLAGGTSYGQINPFLQAGLAAAFNQGKELGTPYPMLMPGQTMNNPNPQSQWPGWFSTALGGFLASTPQLTLWQQQRAQAINHASGRDVVNANGVYQSPLSDYLLGYAGLPIRNVSLAGAAQRRAKDEATLAGEARSF